MVEIFATSHSLRVVFKNGLHPWDVDEYFLEDLQGNCGNSDSFSLHGVTFTNTAYGLLVDPGDNFLFIRNTGQLRASWSGKVILTSHGGECDVELIGSRGDKKVAA